MKKTFDKKMMAVLATSRGLSFEQLRGLSFEQLRGLSGEQLSWLSGEQLSWLSGEQLAPSVPNLYSQLLSDLREKKRLFEQSTFGPDTVKEEALRKTPMCIAGHTVNLAGAEGYALAKKYGFAGAAFLIHRASRPDVGAPRYDVYPNDWALAYIEMRAEEEARVLGEAAAWRSQKLQQYSASPAWYHKASLTIGVDSEEAGRCH